MKKKYRAHRKKTVSVHVRVHESTAKTMQKLKRYQLETYDEVITRLLNFYMDKNKRNGGDEE